MTWWQYLSIHSQSDLFKFIIIAYGIHPSCGHVHLQGGTYTNNCLIKDQVAPEHFWGLIHQGIRPRINPCPKHGYLGPCLGAPDLSRGFNSLVLYQEPQSYIGGPLKGLYFLILDKEPQWYTVVPNKGLFPWH